MEETGIEQMLDVQIASLGRALAARDDGAGVAHAAPGRSIFGFWAVA